MRLRNLAAVLIATLSVSTALASAATLKIGDPAPALSVGKWIKGEPVAAIETGKVYVVEFWATWCGPCRATIPHLSELAKEHPEVVFIGQNVWERNDALIEPFVAEMGEKMSYRVATDDKSRNATGSMAATWMEAAGRDSIPSAFIVDKTKTVVWIGHPAGMDDVLAKVITGNFDIEAAKRQATEDEAKQAEMQAVGQEFQSTVAPKLQAKDAVGAAAALDDLIAAHPAVKKELLSIKFGVLLEAKQYPKAYEAADAIAEAAPSDAAALNALAWLIVDQPGIEQRDLDRALTYATRAVTVSEEKVASIIDTLARVYADKGETAQAIEWQTKAVAAATSEEEKTAMQATLTAYQAKAK